jgi:dienelactone hydrolase
MPRCLPVLVCLLLLAACGSSSNDSGSGGAAPTLPSEVNSIAPATVVQGNPAILTIQGVRFTGTTTVNLAGPSPATLVFRVLSDTTLEADLSASQPAGVYTLTVTTPAGSNTGSPALTIQASGGGPTPPSVGGITPTRALNDRATTLTLTGSALAGATAAVLGDPAATVLPITSTTSTTVTVTLPAGVAPGAWTVSVTTPGGTAGSAPATVTVLDLLNPDTAGAFAAGWRDGTMPGAHGDTPAFRLYYPAQSAAQNAAPDSLGAPYPCVVYSHGFKAPVFPGGIDYTANAFLAAWLAGHGYVVICPDQSPNNDLFGTAQQNCQRDADDARAAINHLAQLNGTAGHPLQGLLDLSRVAVGGHSRGGCASVIASSDEVAALGAGARIKACFLFGSPSRDSQVSGTPMLNFGNFSTIPLLAVAASNDGVAPLVNQQEIFALAGSPSMLFQIIGGNHSQYKDNATQLIGDSAATIALAVQHAVCRRYVTAWLGKHVKGLAAMNPYIGSGAQAASDTRINTITVK